MGLVARSMIGWLNGWVDGTKEFVYTVHCQVGWQFSVECRKAQFWDLSCSWFILTIWILELKIAFWNSQMIQRFSARCPIQRATDIYHLIEWSTDWQMLFNMDKCKVMHFGKRIRSMSTSWMVINWIVLPQKRTWEFGFSHDLKASQQCIQAYSKANKLLVDLNRTIKCKDVGNLLCFYKSLIRPHLEFCTAAWSPNNVKDKVLIELECWQLTCQFPTWRSPVLCSFDRGNSMYEQQRWMFTIGLLNFRSGSEAQYASSCQISRRLVDPFRRYGRFSIFKMAAVRHLGFLKVGNFNFRSHLEAQFASLCQISRRSVEQLWRYSRFSIFKMAAVRHLGFS